MQIKNTIRYPFTTSHLMDDSIIKQTNSNNKRKHKITSIGEDVEKLELSYLLHFWWECIATVENSLMIPQKVKLRITIRPSNSTPRHIPQNN